MSNDRSRGSLGAAALEYVKDHRREIIERLSSLEDFPPSATPQSYFMAGSPGAGKTEFSKEFCKSLCEKDPTYKIIRLDADEARSLLPGYDGSNSHEVQQAASRVVDKVFDSVLSRDQNVLLDGTFASYDRARSNVQRSLAKGRDVGVFYIYQDPIVAWEFTKKREVVEGRNIPKEAFVHAYFESRETVRKIKEEFGAKVSLNAVIKSTENAVEKFHINVNNIDSYVKLRYNPSTLREALHD